MDANQTASQQPSQKNSMAQSSAPTQQDHAKLTTFLSFLERLGLIAAAIAPAVAAPFIKSQSGQAIESAEAPILQQVLSGIIQSQSQSQG